MGVPQPQNTGGHRFLRVPNLTVSLDKDLMHQVKAHPGINWSEAAREGIRRRLQEAHLWDELLKDSRLTDEDVRHLAAKVDAAMLDRLGLLVD